MSIVEKALRACLIGSIKPLEFKKSTEITPVFKDATGLYLHIPLCRNCCSFCPYVKEQYTIEKGDLLFESVKREINIFSEQFSPMQTTSLYIGGEALFC